MVNQGQGQNKNMYAMSGVLTVEGALDHFLSYDIKKPKGEPKFEKFEVIVNEGDPGPGALYIILEGNVRVRKMIGGKENILTTLTAGELFGEISLFDRGKRSADIVANSSGVLLRISLEVFDRMVDKQPEVATPFLVAVARKMAARMRADNERHKKDTILMQTRR